MCAISLMFKQQISLFFYPQEDFSNNLVLVWGKKSDLSSIFMTKNSQAFVFLESCDACSLLFKMVTEACTGCTGVLTSSFLKYLYKEVCQHSGEQLC